MVLVLALRSSEERYGSLVSAAVASEHRRQQGFCSSPSEWQVCAVCHWRRDAKLFVCLTHSLYVHVNVVLSTLDIVPSVKAGGKNFNFPCVQLQ